MARARNLKPSFFTDDEIAELHPLCRLLFQGLWCLADREGRLEDKPKRIKVELLPYDNCNVERMLQALHDARFIVRYEVGGRRLILVRQFAKHQNPHVKEAPSILPPPAQTQCEHSASQMLDLEIPEQAGRIPDSGFPQPDSREKQGARKHAPSLPADPPSGVQAETWAAWVRHKGRKQTLEADRLQRKHLAAWAADGHDPNAIVEAAVAGAWQGLHAPDRPAPRSGSPPRETARERALRNMDEITGKANGHASISGTAERVGGGPVPALPHGLREPGRVDVGGREP